MMSGIRGRDTQPELVLRRQLFRLGIRFRLHVASLPGRPDIVIHRHRVAILVHGCFWHAHAGCRYFKLPAGNRQFWATKLDKNTERDARSREALLSMGWRVGVVWECAIRRNPGRSVELVLKFLDSDLTQMEVSEDTVTDDRQCSPA